jgi:hypothetical protein
MDVYSDDESLNQSTINKSLDQSKEFNDESTERLDEAGESLNNSAEKKTDKENGGPAEDRILHVDDFLDLNLIESDKWEKNYEKIQTRLDNKMIEKNIRDFKKNASHLDGICGFIVGSNKFMKKKGDINGYVSNFKFKSLLINL